MCNMSYCPHTQLIYFYLLDNPAAGHKNTFRENRTYFCNSPIFPNLSSKCFQSRFWCYLFLFNQPFNGKTLRRDLHRWSICGTMFGILYPKHITNGHIFNNEMRMSAHNNTLVLNLHAHSKILRIESLTKSSRDWVLWILFSPVLNVLVDRLLEDTDLLLRKGFSLDDVLKNLSGKGKRNRTKTSDGMNFMKNVFNGWMILKCVIIFIGQGYYKNVCIHRIKISIK